MGAGQAPVGRPLGVYPLTLVSPATLSRQASGPMPSVPPWPASLGRVGVWAPEPPELPRLSVGISFMARGDSAPSQQKAGEELGKHHWPLFPQLCPWVHMGTGKLGKGKRDWSCPPSRQQSLPMLLGSLPLSPKDGETAPVQGVMVLGLQPLQRAGCGPRVRGFGLGFKCPPSQALPSVGSLRQGRGQDRERKEDWACWCLPGVSPGLACLPLTTVFVP